MRTRTSWRNQERVHKYLTPPTIKTKSVASIPTDAEIDAMFWLSKQSKRLAKLDAAKRRAVEVEKDGESNG